MLGLSYRVRGPYTFEPGSTNLFVSRTMPNCCDHSDTRLPTTCPQRLFGSCMANSIAKATPLSTRKIEREWSSTNFRAGVRPLSFGRRLSREPFSKHTFVTRIVITTPLQSAMALPKNEPTCFCGSESTYRTAQVSVMDPAMMLSECRLKKFGCEECFWAASGLNRMPE